MRERADDPATVSVEEAARMVGIGRTLAYQNARQHGYVVPSVPVLRCGRHKLVVPVAPLRRALGLDA